MKDTGEEKSSSRETQEIFTQWDSPFTAGIYIVLRSPPRIASDAINVSLAISYYNAAKIPDSLGNPWSTTSPDILDETEVAAGMLFSGSVRKYDIFVAPHTSTIYVDDPAFQTQMNNFLQRGGHLLANCAAIEAFENTAGLGPFLTYNGIPTVLSSDVNHGDTGTFTVAAPDLPLAQAVATTLPQSLPGGAIQTSKHNPANYWPSTQVMAYFTAASQGGAQYDFAITGPAKGSGGRVTYIGGHSFSNGLPYSSNIQGPYLRFFFNTLFYNVAVPRPTTSPGPKPPQPSEAATGGGWYTLADNSKIDFSFNVNQVPNTANPIKYKGEINLISEGKWRLKGTLDAYALFDSVGVAIGSGQLYGWYTVLDKDGGGWLLAQDNVNYAIHFTDSGSGKGNPDKFGIYIDYLSGVLVPLPNSDLIELKGGNIDIKSK